MLNTRFSPWPSYDEEEIAAVCSVLRTNQVNYWTGQEGRNFEREFASWTGVKYAIALANGTVALNLALLALGLGPGDEVIVTSRTFVASASSIVLVGATPIFADVDRDTQNITVETIKAALSSKSKAIICVHLAGWPCDMDSIMELAKQHGLYVIEDCAQAHGARYKDRSVGSIGHISAWSFCQDKIITTGGEGGMVTTNDPLLWEWMWSYKDHGKSWKAVNDKNNSLGFRWLHDSVGTNWRMTEMQAAIGRIQLKKMDGWQEKRLKNANMIWALARTLSAVRAPIVPGYILHAAYKCYIFVENDYLRDGWSRDRILYEINESGVPCFTGSCSEVYLEKAFDNTISRPNRQLAITRELGQTSLMFLVHPTLTQDDMARTCDVLKRILSIAGVPMPCHADEINVI